jgi:hypothetical protein
MIEWIKKMFQDIQDKKQKKKKLSELIIELDEAQKYLDHEGKMRGMCDYDEDDMKHFYYAQRKRDEKRTEVEKYKRDNNL